MSESTAALEGSTLHQLLSDDENRLLDAIDELRSQGIGKLLGDKGLPQIIVCGDQSSGKSSVLEALTRVRFPTKSSVCTTFPTELRLRREPKSHISCRIKPGNSRSSEEKERLTRFQESFDSPDRFPELISSARKCMSEAANGTADAFFDDVLEVEIVGPKLAPLTIVDLPGLIHYRNASSADRDIKLVSSLVESYMKQDNSIILAVVSAHNDLNNQTVLTRIKSMVPGGHRTLGIITKPDELPSGSEKEQEYLDYARSNPMKFQYGWHVVRNRNYEEQGNSFEQRDDKEREFFASSNWNALPPREVGLGIDSLREKLSRMLLDHITLNLPSIVDQLSADLSQSESELHKLGEARNSPKDQRNYLSDISDSFGDYTRDALDGRYRRRSFFGDPLSAEGLQKRLRANIRNLNDDFAREMLERGHKWHILEDSQVSTWYPRPQCPEHPNVITKSVFLKDHVDTLAYQERGNELPGVSNPLLVGSLFHEQSSPWEAIASKHLKTVWEAVKDFLEALLAHLTDERTCNQLLIHVIDPAMETRQERLKAKLGELLVPHRDHDPLNVDPQFARKIWSMREKRITTSIVEAMRQEMGVNGSVREDALPSVDQIMARITSTNPMVDNKYGSLETLEFMEAYYENTIPVFINNVASLGVEQCLLDGLVKIFSSATVRDMDDEKLALISAESRETLNERVRISERVKIVRKGLQTIRRIHPVHAGPRMNRNVNQGTQAGSPGATSSSPTANAAQSSSNSQSGSAPTGVSTPGFLVNSRPSNPSPAIASRAQQSGRSVSTNVGTPSTNPQQTGNNPFGARTASPSSAPGSTTQQTVNGLFSNPGTSASKTPPAGSGLFGNPGASNVFPFFGKPTQAASASGAGTQGFNGFGAQGASGFGGTNKFPPTTQRD